MGNAYELNLALFRVYPVRIAYPDSFAPDQQDGIIAAVEAFGRRFPEDLNAFQRQYLNFCRLLEEAELLRQTEHGTQPVPLAELREGQGELSTSTTTRSTRCWCSIRRCRWRSLHWAAG